VLVAVDAKVAVGVFSGGAPQLIRNVYGLGVTLVRSGLTKTAPLLPCGSWADVAAGSSFTRFLLSVCEQFIERDTMGPVYALSGNCGMMLVEAAWFTTPCLLKLSGGGSVSSAPRTLKPPASGQTISVAPIAVGL
jgi:hypothetical protein